MNEQAFGWWMVAGSWATGTAGIALVAMEYRLTGLLLVGLAVGLAGFALWRLR